MTETKVRILRRREVESRVGLKRSALYQSMAEDRFPKAVRLGPHAIGWVEAEIDAWLAARIAERDASSK